MRYLNSLHFQLKLQYLLWCFVLTPFLVEAQKKPVPQPSKALYRAKDAGHYMPTWWVLGPLAINGDSSVKPDAAIQNKFFDEDQLSVADVNLTKEKRPVLVSGKEFQWKLYTSKKDIVDLDSIFKGDYAAAYAWAEVIADSACRAFLVVGSDDAIKVWHNGKLVHNNWVARGLTPDEDMIPIDLVKGTNQILIKVQDITQGWGFTAKFLEGAGLSDRLIVAAGRGILDEINSLLLAGASVERSDLSGLSPLDAARLQGRDETVKLLLQKGAKEHSLPLPEKLVDGMYSSLIGKVAPGVAVLVAKDGKIIYKKGFGYANLEKKEKVSTETKFRIGSVTKQFTASAILKLQEENRLNVTDKLSKYFPDFPRGEEVTLHHLLTHTSGIHSYTGKSDFISKVTSPITNENLLLYFKNDPYDFNPGELYMYNNAGYFLLGYIVEKVSGKSYGQYLEDTFFHPLKMNNTGVHSAVVAIKNEAKGYNKTGDKYDAALNLDMSWIGGAGALYSTVEDLYKWNEALFNGKVLNEKSLGAAFTSVNLNNGKIPPDGEYGYGIVPGHYRDLVTIQHSGGLHGFLSQLTRFPKENLTVVILTNQWPKEVNLNANRIAECYLWEKMAKQPSYSAQSSLEQNLKVYEGRYDFPNGAVMTITLEGKQLFAKLTGKLKSPIFSFAPEEFFWKEADTKIRFFKNEKGEVIQGHYSQGGKELDVLKLPDEVIVSVDPSIVKAYIGKYDAGDNFILNIVVEDNAVFIKVTNLPTFEIVPVSEKEFIGKDINMRISFERGPDNKVSKLIINQAGMKRDAPKIE